jgi:hypothetical protein
MSSFNRVDLSKGAGHPPFTRYVRSKALVFSVLSLDSTAGSPRWAPADDMPRLPEREYFSAAGILAVSLALSELCLSLAEINIEATRRSVGISLGCRIWISSTRKRSALRSSICPAIFGCWDWAISATLVCGRWRPFPMKTRRRSNLPFLISTRSKRTAASFSRWISFAVSKLALATYG